MKIIEEVNESKQTYQIGDIFKSTETGSYYMLRFLSGACYLVSLTSEHLITENDMIELLNEQIEKNHLIHYSKDSFDLKLVRK